MNFSFEVEVHPLKGVKNIYKKRIKWIKKQR